MTLRDAIVGICRLQTKLNAPHLDLHKGKIMLIQASLRMIYGREKLLWKTGYFQNIAGESRDRLTIYALRQEIQPN